MGIPLTKRNFYITYFLFFISVAVLIASVANAWVHAWVQTASVRAVVPASADWRLESTGYVVVVTCVEVRKFCHLPEFYKSSRSQRKN